MAKVMRDLLTLKDKGHITWFCLLGRIKHIGGEATGFRESRIGTMNLSVRGNQLTVGSFPLTVTPLDAFIRCLKTGRSAAAA